MGRPSPSEFPSPLATLLTLGVCLLFQVACGGEDAPPRPVDLEDLPSIDTSSFETGVAEALQNGRDEVERLRASLTAPELSELYGGLGELHHAYELHRAALVCYRNAAALFPDEPRWPRLAGHAHRALGESDAAVAQLERARDLTRGGDPQVAAVVSLALGEALLEAGRPEGAKTELEAALTRVPSLAPAHFHLGRLAAERGDPEQAVRHFQRALDLQPEATVVHLPLAAAHRALGNDDAAERHAGLRGEGSLNLEDPWLARMRGRATGASRQLDTGARAFAQGEFERAEAAFRNAVEQAPEDAVARLNLGSALARLGRVDEAREQLRRAADLDPENARVHFNLAKLEAAGGDTAAAVSGYRRALELDPSYLSARFNLANTLLRSGDFDDALDAFRQVVATDAAHGPASLGEMVCLSRLGRDAEAIARAEAARQALPESPAMAEALARLLSASPPELRDGPRALGILSGLVAESTDLGTIEALAMAHAAAGDFPQAVSWQERALAAVRQSRRADLVAPMAANLARYRQGQVAEAPWHGAAFGAEW